jgi:hypothetical protein
MSMNPLEDPFCFIFEAIMFLPCQTSDPDTSFLSKSVSAPFLGCFSLEPPGVCQRVGSFSAMQLVKISHQSKYAVLWHL